jgi:hypothetical protein
MDDRLGTVARGGDAGILVFLVARLRRRTRPVVKGRSLFDFVDRASAHLCYLMRLSRRSRRGRPDGILFGSTREIEFVAERFAATRNFAQRACSSIATNRDV